MQVYECEKDIAKHSQMPNYPPPIPPNEKLIYFVGFKDYSPEEYKKKGFKVYCTDYKDYQRCVWFNSETNEWAGFDGKKVRCGIPKR